jgi:hypothetical protein
MKIKFLCNKGFEQGIYNICATLSCKENLDNKYFSYMYYGGIDFPG